MVSKQEFEEVLLRDDVAQVYLAKEKAEVTKDLGEKVSRMVGFDQKNSHHCYKLWEHTIRTVEGIKKDELMPEDFKKLRIAAFFHDVGKPDVAKFNPKTGQQVFYGHAGHSVEVAKPILEQLGYSEEEINQMSFYIGHHDDFISYKSKIEPNMKHHEFIREINENSVAEKILENQFDFEAMGYDKDQIRAIVFTLVNGKEPEFRDFKGRPIKIDININEVRTKMDSGEYGVNYSPTKEDYNMLLKLCKADAGAQKEVVMQNGRQVSSRAEKLENMTNIEDVVENAFDKVAVITKPEINKEKKEMEEKRIDSDKQKLLEALKVLKDNGELPVEGDLSWTKLCKNEEVIGEIAGYLYDLSGESCYDYATYVLDYYGKTCTLERYVRRNENGEVESAGYVGGWSEHYEDASYGVMSGGTSHYVTDEEFEQYYYNTIDIMKLGKSIGMEEQEKTLPNGKVIKSLVWDQENLKKAVKAVSGLSEEGKPVRITGAAPAWLVSALTHTVHPCPVSLYDPKLRKNIDIPQLAHGEQNPEGEVAFEVTEKGDAVLVEWNIDHESGIYDENNLPKVVVPEVPQGKEVYISGRGPNYLTVAMAEAYAHTNSSVSLNQPGIGYTCSITHTRSKNLGDLTKDPLGKEQMKADLAASKEDKNQEVK